jgi:hypothetical protein
MVWSDGASARTTGAGDWMEAHAREVVARLQGSYGGGSENDGRKKKGEWGQPRPEPLYL